MTVNGIKCLICEDEIWSRKVHDKETCRCHSVSVEGGQRHIEVTGLKQNYEVIEIEVKIEEGDSLWMMSNN
jgi:hypothetical protein